VPALDVQLQQCYCALVNILLLPLFYITDDVVNRFSLFTAFSAFVFNIAFFFLNFFNYVFLIVSCGQNAILNSYH
jgi:hypothetical protein